jgi:predicted Fe-Mo cluster-binding NifX family protein
MNGLDAVITGKMGDCAEDLLKGAGIPVHIFRGRGTVQNALDAVTVTSSYRA